MRRVHSWFGHGQPMTRREFYALYAVLFLMITLALIGLKRLSDSRVTERQRADYRGCVFTRDHVVLPDRATVLTSPYKNAPLLAKLGFTPKQIEGYLRKTYGGVDPKLLEAPPPNGLGLAHRRALELTNGPPNTVAAELARRHVPNCIDPDAAKPPGGGEKP